MVITSDIPPFKTLMQELDEDISSVLQVIRFLEQHDADAELVLHEKAKDSQQAAKAIGINLDQIAKSIVFVAEDQPERGWVTLAQGNARIDTEALQSLTETSLRMATPEEVSTLTPFRVGGVSPFAQSLPVIVDEPVLRVSPIQPAAGSTCVGALLTPSELVRITRAQISSISRGSQ